MKKSNITLLLSFAFAMAYFLFPAVFGSISVDQQGKPTDFMSKFWLNMSPKTNLEFEQAINHIKIIGSEEATISLVINKGNGYRLNSKDMHNFNYKFHKDTLEIRLKKENTYLELEQPTPIHTISCANKTDLQLIPIETRDSLQKLAITLEDNSTLKMGEYTKKYGYATSSANQGPVTIKNLELHLSNQSSAYLGSIQTDKCIAKLTDAFLNCERSDKIDSLKIQLNGKSTIKNTTPTMDNRGNISVKDNNSSNIGHLIVSGNMEYFNKKFIRPNTQITIEQ